MRAGGVVFCVWLSAAAPLVAAATPTYEGAGAYAYMHDNDRSENFPAGWAFAATGTGNSGSGLVVDAGGNDTVCQSRQRGPFATQAFRGTDLDIRIHTYLGGPRIASHALSAVTPFAQVLFGGSHMSGGTEFDGALNTGFTYQPGAGLDVHVAPRIAIRVEGDYRVIRTTGHNNKESRVLAGAVYAFGTQ